VLHAVQSQIFLPVFVLAHTLIPRKQSHLVFGSAGYDFVLPPVLAYDYAKKQVRTPVV
jgi:hypothetical protein